MYRVVIEMLEIALIDVKRRDLTLTGKSFVTISITTPFASKLNKAIKVFGFYSNKKVSSPSLYASISL